MHNTTLNRLLRALVPAALGASLTFVGCSGDDGSGTAEDSSATDVDVADDSAGQSDTGSVQSCAGAPSGTACDDGDPCTVDDECEGGLCVGGSTLVCDDPSPCRTGRCVSGEGCVFEDVADDEPCALACFDEATCQAGRCEPSTGSAKPCPESSEPCVDRWSCDPTTGECTIPIYAPAGHACDLDEDVCTLDTCDGDGSCVVSGDLETCSAQSANNPCWTYSCVKKSGCVRSTFVSGASCDDLNPCTSNDTCTVTPSGQEGCLGTPLPIDDGNPCTDDGCAGGVVEHTPIDGVVCAVPDDLCQGSGLCEGGVCKTSPAVDCDDDDVCTVDSCVPGTGACAHTPAADGTDCDDGDACTTLDRCASGQCAGLVLGNCCGNGLCEDGERCGCSDCDGVSCDDGLACTDGDQCADGQCVGAPISGCCGNGVCEAGEACGCAADCAGEPCEGDACVGGQTCQSDGTCGGGSPLAECCGDGDCTAGEVCGCPADCAGESCDDGDPDTLGDVCQADGSCLGSGCPAGNEGAFAPTSDGTLSGSHVFTSLSIPAGVTISGAGSAPLEIVVCGDAIIAGTLSVSGGKGQFSWGANATNGNPSGAPGGAGGVACCGGANGGNGGHSPSGTGTVGSGTGGGKTGTSTSSGQYKNGGNSGGGGHGTAGNRGYSSSGTGSAGAGGNAYGSATMAPPTGGSGGAGGSGGLGGASTGYGGSGGGAGGRIIVLEVYGELSIADTGAVRADGGKAGTNQNIGAVGDGGHGAGGGIVLKATTLVNHGEVTALGAVNSPINGSTIDDGRGGDGRIRVDTGTGALPAGTFAPAPGYVGSY